MKQSLRLEGGLQRLNGGVKRSTKGIPDNLKYISILGANGLVQYFVMPRQERRHFRRVLLHQLRAAFDVCKKKCNRTAWQARHRVSIQQKQRRKPVLLAFCNQSLYNENAQTHGGLMKQDRFLAGILVGIAVLVVIALAVFFMRQNSQS